MMVIHSYVLPGEIEQDILSDEETLSLREAGRELGVTRARVWQLIHEGKLRGFMSEGIWCITPQAIRDFRARKFLRR